MKSAHRFKEATLTEPEQRIAVALASCSFLPASWDKRFARDMAFVAQHFPEREITDRQRAHLLRLTHKYRRQLPVKIITLALDEMEAAAKQRVESGAPALPDFSSRHRRIPDKSRTYPGWDAPQSPSGTQARVPSRADCSDLPLFSRREK